MTDRRKQAGPAGHESPDDRSPSEREAMLRVIFDGAYEFIGLLTPDGVLLDANKSALEFAGAGLADVKGRPFWDTPWWESSETCRERLKLAITEARAGKVVRFEAIHGNSKGQTIDVDFTLTPILDAEGRVAYLEPEGRDISDRKRIETELRASQARLAGILDNADDAIVSVDADQRITHFNHGAEHIFGYTAADVVGKPLGMLMPERYRGRHRGLIGEFAKGTVTAAKMGQRGQIVGRRRDGTEFPAEATILKQEASGGFEFTTILRDATEQKRAEELLEQRVEERTEALRQEMKRHQEAQEALGRLQRMEMLGQLTGGVAHDFNNLLTVISGNLQLIGMVIEDERTRKYLEEAERATEMGARLNQRLMTFARQRRLAPAPTNLNDEVIGVRELLRRSLGELITLTTDLGDDLWTVLVDPSEIENALVNLAINARDAMPEGGLLTVTTENSMIATDDSRVRDGLAPGSYVLLSVSDTGHGMSPEVKAHAFEPFFTTKGPGKGTGLGLATVYGFVKQSGGHIRLGSEPGRGTRFEIYLPRLAGRAASTTPERPLSDTGRPPSGTILVVEDNVDVRRVTVERLKALGYRPLEAENGRDALSLIERSGPVDLVFSDIVMPGGMSGFDLARVIRERWPGQRMLLTSGFAGTAAAEGGGQLTDLEILGKPYSQAALEQALAKAIKPGS